MAVLACVDGSSLRVVPVPVLDRDGVPYEVTLRLERDGEHFGDVGERCGYFLAATAERMRAAQEAGEEYPPSSAEAGILSWAADVGADGPDAWAEISRYLPRDRELFCFRSRDPDDLTTVGELRVTLEVERTWAQGWQVRCVAVVCASGTAGVGVRAVLDSTGLRRLLDALVADFAAVGLEYDDRDDASALRRPVG